MVVEIYLPTIDHPAGFVKTEELFSVQELVA